MAKDHPAFPLPSNRSHRLDTPASGCLLLAKTWEAAVFLSTAFAAAALADPESPVEKRYWAITEPPGNDVHCVGDATLCAGERKLCHWIQFSPKTNKSFALDEKQPGAKEARLFWRLAGRGEGYLFLEIRLVTGRHHQIRAPIAALGLPIKGDLKYGVRRGEKQGGIRSHTRYLHFPNPLALLEPIRVEAPPPGGLALGCISQQRADVKGTMRTINNPVPKRLNLIYKKEK